MLDGFSAIHIKLLSLIVTDSFSDVKLGLHDLNWIWCKH